MQTDWFLIFMKLCLHALKCTGISGDRFLGKGTESSTRVFVNQTRKSSKVKLSSGALLTLPALLTRLNDPNFSEYSGVGVYSSRKGDGEPSKVSALTGKYEYE